MNKNSVSKPGRSAVPVERGAAEKPTLAVAPALITNGGVSFQQNGTSAKMFKGGFHVSVNVMRDLSSNAV